MVFLMQGHHLVKAFCRAVERESEVADASGLPFLKEEIHYSGAAET